MISLSKTSRLVEATLSTEELAMTRFSVAIAETSYLAGLVLTLLMVVLAMI